MLNDDNEGDDKKSGNDDNSKHIWRACLVPDAVLRALHVWTHLIWAKTLEDKTYYYSCFTDK